jgi:hypothetical protein
MLLWVHFFLSLSTRAQVLAYPYRLESLPTGHHLTAEVSRWVQQPQCAHKEIGGFVAKHKQALASAALDLASVLGPESVRKGRAVVEIMTGRHLITGEPLPADRVANAASSVQRMKVLKSALVVTADAGRRARETGLRHTNPFLENQATPFVQAQGFLHMMSEVSLDIGTSHVPGVSQIRGAYELATGKHAITGQQLTLAQRCAAAASCVPPGVHSTAAKAAVELVRRVSDHIDLEEKKTPAGLRRIRSAPPAIGLPRSRRDSIPATSLRRL